MRRHQHRAAVRHRHRLQFLFLREEGRLDAQPAVELAAAHFTFQMDGQILELRGDEVELEIGLRSEQTPITVDAVGAPHALQFDLAEVDAPSPSLFGFEQDMKREIVLLFTVFDPSVGGEGGRREGKHTDIGKGSREGSALRRGQFGDQIDVDVGLLQDDRQIVALPDQPTGADLLRLSFVHEVDGERRRFVQGKLVAQLGPDEPAGDGQPEGDDEAAEPARRHGVFRDRRTFGEIVGIVARDGPESKGIVRLSCPSSAGGTLGVPSAPGTGRRASPRGFPRGAWEPGDQET